MSFIHSLLLRLALSILNVAWEILWDIVEEAILEAERLWKKSGTGEVKKVWVMKKAMEFAESQVKLNFVTRWIVREAVSRTIDYIIDRLNKEFEDHNWIKYVDDLRKYFEKFIPGID